MLKFGSSFLVVPVWLSIAKYSQLSLRRTTWDRYYVSVLERRLSSRDTTQWSKERQGTTLGVRFIEVFVI